MIFEVIGGKSFHALNYEFTIISF